MIPVVVGIGIGISAGAGVLLKKRCNTCSSKFKILEQCSLCDKLLCKKCGTDIGPVVYQGWQILDKAYRHCAIHATEAETKLKEIKLAVDKESSVKVYSASYKGKTPLPKHGKWIESDNYRDRDDALKHLRILAAMHGADCITKTEFNYIQRQDDNYIYKVWYYKGLI